MRPTRVLVALVVFGSLVTANRPFAPASVAHAATTTTFSFTGEAETFTVPAGVISVQIKARGAQGGETIRYGMPNSAGGLAGQLIVTLSVTPGDVLTVQVGGIGANSEMRTATGNGGFLIAGGWPDGGNGYVKSSFGAGAGGGGSTRVYKKIAGVDTLVLVAAGGGGASVTDEGGAGGRPGSLAGEQGGLPGAPLDGNGSRPGGATQSAGGAGGCIDADFDNTAETCAGSGGALAGGNNTEPLTGDAYGGAGGGGGYYGGGAGSYNSSGGGGSSWRDPARTEFVDDSAVSTTGNGTVELLYTVITCSPGTFGVEGKAPCAPALPGRYVPGAGATADVPAPAGSFVNVAGSHIAFLCPPGSYQPSQGQLSCILASVNHYVAEPGATAQIACPSGYEATSQGSMTCTASATTVPSQTTVPPQTTVPVTTIPTATTQAPSLPTPAAPRVARAVGVGRSFVVTAKNQKNATGQKVSLTSSTGTCRVAKTAKGFTVTGVKKGTCTLVMKVTGDNKYGSLRTTTVVRVG